MTDPRVLLIGGTGKTGKRVARQLEEKGIDFQLATRHPKQAKDRYFDWEKPCSDSVFTGISSIYLVSPTHSSDHRAIVRPVLEQALAQGVKRFVLLSASSLPEGGPLMGQTHAFLRQHAPEWCVLRPTWFMQNLSEQHHQATIKNEGKIYSATEIWRIGFIDAEDIARSAVTALLASEAPNNDFILTGPKTLSYGEVAELLSADLGFSVEYVPLTVEQMAARYQLSGLDADYAQLLAAMDRDVAQGGEDRLSENVKKLTGKEPNSMAQFIKRTRQSWLT